MNHMQSFFSILNIFITLYRLCVPVPFVGVMLGELRAGTDAICDEISQEETGLAIAEMQK